MENPQVSILLKALGVILVAAKLFSWALQAWRRHQLARKHSCMPMARLPQRDPILGVDVLLNELEQVEQKTYLESFLSKYNTLGRTWAYKPLNKLTINTIEPKNIEVVLKTSFHCFELGQNRMNVLEPSIEHGLLTLNSSVWHNARKLMQPGVNRKFVHRVPFEKYTQRLISQIPSDGITPVNLAPLFGRFTFDSSWDLIFGRDINALDLPNGSEEARQVEEALAQILDRTYHCMTRGYLAIWWPRKGHRKDLQTMLDLIDKEIVRALDRNMANTTLDNPSMIDLFTSHDAQQRAKTERSGGLDELRNVVRGQISHIVLAGRDTTANLLSNLFLELSKHPRVWQKLVEEVEPLNGSPPDISGLGNFHYLRHCINETLRLYPPAPMNNRRATEDIILPTGGGPYGKDPILVVKGDEITFHLYAMGRREEFFGSDVNEFIPERWEYIQPGWAFVPFSAGRRSCIGRQFALDEASYVTIRLLQTFTGIKKHGDKPWVEELRILVGNCNGTVVTLTGREGINC